MRLWGSINVWSYHAATAEAAAFHAATAEAASLNAATAEANALKYLDSMYPHVDQFHFELFQIDHRDGAYWMLKEIRTFNTPDQSCSRISLTPSSFMLLMILLTSLSVWFLNDCTLPCSNSWGSSLPCSNSSGTKRSWLRLNLLLRKEWKMLWRMDLKDS